MDIRRRLRGSEDRGMTLVEVLITMILMAVVGTLVTGAVVQASRGLVHVDDENAGLQDAKVILDRMARDVREARSVVCDGGLADPTDISTADPSCTAHLQLWIDTNSDYVQQSSEVVTWRLERNPDGLHFDVWRITGTGASAIRHRQASALIVNNVYAYQDGLQPPHAAAPADAEVVNIALSYDAISGRGAKTRHAALTVRLRNKGTR
jgi:prepilin-type N-terminal cleavage/methylation domain-containing protein